MKNKNDFIFDMLKYYGDYDKNNINKLVSNNEKNTINNLREEQVRFGVHENLYSEEKNEKRAIKIYSTVKKYIDIDVKSFLDFGGGSCDIAFHMGNLIGAQEVYCIDIDEWVDIKWKRRNNVTFFNNLEKIKDNSINLILASHVLHHIDDNQIKDIINDFQRVLSNDGIIILKEHDCQNDEFAKLLDLQHMIYDTVITQTTTYDKFKKSFYSNYKSTKDWNKLFSNFTLVKTIKKKNYDNTYFAIYKKIKLNSQNMNYPYTDNFYTLEEVKEMYEKLRKYKYENRLLYDRYYRIKNLKYDKYKYLFIGRPLLILSEESDYQDFNQIVDYFQNKERVKCRRFGRDYSPYDFFIQKREYIEEMALKYFNEITPFTIRETIFKLKYECSSFRQINLVTFIQMFQPQSVLDFSAGWGERLLSCIVTDTEYTGVDPNSNLFEGYHKLIDIFATNKEKYNLINNTIEEADLGNKMFDMVFTSPPYFDIETYTNDESQSISKYKTEKEWTNNFLKPALEKCYNHLNIGGYMCININQKDKNETYIQEMLDYVYTFEDMHFYGVIGYSDQKITNPQPIWIWRKNQTVPKELYNPSFIIKETNYDNKKFKVVRDDYLIGGTKQRGLVEMMENIDKSIFIYGGPVQGYAQIALSYSAYLTHKKAVVIVEKRQNLFPLTRYAKSFGAFIKEVPQPAYLEKILEYSKKFYEQDKKERYLIKFGADEDIFTENMKKNIKEAWGDNEHPEKLWLVAGSTVLLNVLYSVFPKTFFNVVQVGRKIWEDQLDSKRTKLYISKEKFTRVAVEQPPYPTVSTYDAKLWTFVKRYGEDGDFIWNVGKDIKYHNN